MAKLIGRLGRAVRGVRRRATALGVLALLVLAWLLLPGGLLPVPAGLEAGRGQGGGPGEGGGESVPSPLNRRLVGCRGEGLGRLPVLVVARGERFPAVTGPEGMLVPPAGLGAAAPGEWWGLEALPPGGCPVRLLLPLAARTGEVRLCPETVVLAGGLRPVEGLAGEELAGLELTLFAAAPEGRRRLAGAELEAGGKWRMALPAGAAGGELLLVATQAGRHRGAWLLPPGPKGFVELPVGDRPLRLHAERAMRPTAVPGGSRLLAAPLAAPGAAASSHPWPAAGEMALDLPLGWHEVVLAGPRGGLLAHGRVEVGAAGASLSLAPLPDAVEVTSGAVLGEVGAPLAGARVRWEPLPPAGQEERGGGGELHPALLAEAAVAAVTGVEGRFRLEHGAWPRAVLQVHDPGTGLFARVPLDPSDRKPRTIRLGRAARLALASLSGPEGLGQGWPGRLCWWLLSGDDRVLDHGAIECVPQDLCTIAEGEWRLLLCHDGGASVLVPAPARAGAPAGIEARLRPARRVLVQAGPGPVRLQWLGPGGVVLSGAALAGPAEMAAPAVAEAVAWRRGPGAAAVRALPGGPPARLELP